MFTLMISQPRPYFAEIPYALWGEINYDSEGDCRRPTDQNWRLLELTHRDTDEQVIIVGQGVRFSITASEETLAARAATFLLDRTQAQFIDNDPRLIIGNWAQAGALARAQRVQTVFSNPRLAPFDSHLFWGSWKWIGWFATDLTWVGRWIMHSVLTDDARAVCLCIEWLRQGTIHPDQSSALRSALAHLTGLSWQTDQEWLAWYDQVGFSQFPESDFDQWLADLRAQS